MKETRDWSVWLCIRSAYTRRQYIALLLLLNYWRFAYMVDHVSLCCQMEWRRRVSSPDFGRDPAWNWGWTRSIISPCTRLCASCHREIRLAERGARSARPLAVFIYFFFFSLSFFLSFFLSILLRFEMILASSLAVRWQSRAPWQDGTKRLHDSVIGRRRVLWAALVVPIDYKLTEEAENFKKK